MKKIYFIKYLFTLVLCICISAGLQAQNFKLIDVNKTKNSYPSNYQFSSKNQFAVLKEDFYFQADDGIHGTELWRSDGTAANTKIVDDIKPGTASSSPYDITASGNEIYFLASDSTYYTKLWVSDGTDTGTKLVDNLGAQLYASYENLTDVDGTLYFIYSYSDSSFFSHSQLWKTDSAGSGAVMLADLNMYTYNEKQLVNVNGKLFFIFLDRNTFTYKLYTSDGTAEGTTYVADIANYYSIPSHLTALNGSLYFAADNGTGNKLWMSDGTAAGTHAVKNKHNIYLAAGALGQIDPFTVKNNTLFFQGTAVTSHNDSTSVPGDSAISTTTSGNELCKYNTSDTNNNVTLVKDIIPGKKSSYPSFITNVNGTLFFTIGPDSADAQLWKSDGTKAGTVLVKDINPGGINYYYGLTNVNGTLLFAYGNNALGTELWKSNGTSTGTVLVKDILPGGSSSYPGYFTYKNGIFLFGANGPKGNELWRSDGTQAGTVMVKNINYTSTSSSGAYGFTATADNKVVFSAYNGKTPGNLFVTDGSDAGTKSISSSAYVRYLYTTGKEFIKFKNEDYFIDYSNRLWKTDGTKAGTSLLPIPALVKPDSGYIINLVATEKVLYIFTTNYATNQIAILRTDGTTAGTYALKSDLSSYYNLYPTVVGNTLFFANFDYSTGAQLWKTDGTVAGTVIVKAINGYNYNPLANLYNFNGKLYFSAYTTTNSFGPSLWTSDGTEAGTMVVKDVAVGPQQSFAQANGKLLFYALDAISKGYELFVSNGTAAGTRIVKDINRGGASSNVNSIISGDTIVYFIADDGKHGQELWKSDGTNKGTNLVKDITRGINGTYLNNMNMVNVHDNLFFTVNDTLWQSDGTKINTHPVKDNNLNGVTRIYDLTAIGDSLYFSGYTYAAGQELYIGSAKIEKAPNVILTIPDSIVKYTAPATIKLHAEATDEDGTITKVEFYDGTTLLHTEHVIPYGYLWTDVPAGNYTLTAKAYDNSGNVNTSNTIKVSVVTVKTPNEPIVSSRPSSANSKKDFGGALSLKVRPNPASDILHISVNGLQQNKQSAISVIAVSGVIMKTMQINSSGQAVQLNVSSLVSGVYIIKVVSGDKAIYRQFVKL